VNVLRLFIASGALAGLGCAGPVTLYDNLPKSTIAVVPVTSTFWTAGTFSTDNNTYSLISATLLLAAPSIITANGSADLDLYSNSGLVPGSFLATLTAPLSLTTVLGNNTFTASGITLSPNTTYWLVLKGVFGSVSWAETADMTGVGVGFIPERAVTNNSGANWSLGQPLQMQVIADLASVPEPGTFWTHACARRVEAKPDGSRHFIHKACDA
jgi:hypothetical protein